MNTIGFAYLHIENNRRDDILDNMSTADFHSVLYDLFSLRSPFRFKDHISEEVFNEIGLFLWVEGLISKFDSKERLLIEDLEEWPDTLFDARAIAPNLPKEYQKYEARAAFWIFFIEKAGIVRNMDGHWVLTKLTIKNRNKRKAILQMLIEGIGFRMNWSVFDGKAAKETGQLAFGISLIMLHKYGTEWRDAMFYTNKYFHFFELARVESHIENNQSEVDFIQVYIYRSFYCFGKIFNFVEIEDSLSKEGVSTKIRTTSVFQALFDFRL